MRVLQFNRYTRLGASTRLRSLQYLPALAAAGITVESEPFFTDQLLLDFYAGRRRSPVGVLACYWRRLRALRRIETFDCIWIEKELFPFLSAFETRVIGRGRRPVLIDYDDATFHSYDSHKSALVRAILGQKIAKVMRSASVVVVGNDYLRDYAANAGARRIESLPTVVDLTRYNVRHAPRDGVFRIGWIGTPNTVKYLAELQPAVEGLAAEAKGQIILSVVGSGGLGFQGIQIDYMPWAEQSEVSTIATFDVGIMPLPDQPFERGKCGYKLIQYMACGIPVIATPIGVNRDLIQDGVNGFLAKNSDEWLAALRALKGDPELRFRMGRAGRSLVERSYCLQVAAPRLVEILRSLVAN